MLKRFLLLVVICGGLQATSIAETRPPEGQVLLEGVVHDSSGKAIRGAEINAVILSRRSKQHPLAGGTVATVEGRTASDSDGNFQFSVRKPDRKRDIDLELFAYADGHGLAFRFLEIDQDHHQLVMELPEAMPATGKLLGPGGEPLAGVPLSVATLRRTVEGSDPWFPFSAPPSNITAWPPVVTTGSDGAFTLQGIPPQTELVLETADERVARQRWPLDVGPDSEVVRLHAAPPRYVEGTVVSAEDRRPVEDAAVVLTAWGAGDSFVGTVYTATDSRGRFVLRPYFAAELGLRVSADPERYEVLERRIPWPASTTVQGMSLPLYRKGAGPAHGTSRDGETDGTIEAEVPAVEVTRHAPSGKLEDPLEGTIVVSAQIGSDDPVHRIIAIDPQTGRTRDLVKQANSSRISPDGRHLVYGSSASDDTRVMSLLPEASVRRIAGGDLQQAAWVPGTDEFFVNVSDPRRRHYFGEQYWGEESNKLRFNTLGEQVGELAVPALYEVCDVSPDGGWVAMHWDTHAHLTGAQLFVSRIDGTDLRPVARRQAQYYWYPRFSPDGKTLLAKHLNAAEGGGGRISVHTIALDGTEERSLSVSEGYSPEVACWSPDGRWIAVAAYANSAFGGGEKHSEIFVIDPQAHRVRQISFGDSARSIVFDIDWTARDLLKQ